MTWLTLPSEVWAVAIFAVFTGTLVQRLSGQGFGMIAAPLFGLVAPEFLPATLLILGALVGFSATAVDLSQINRQELPPGFAGRALGAVLAAWLALHLSDPRAFALTVGALIWLGILLSISGLRVPIRRTTLFGAGTVAGVMGTLTAVGAPPMALLYQNEATGRAAAMQNVFFLWGMIVSIGALTAVGLVTMQHLSFAAILAPVVILALVIAQPLARHVAQRRIRPVALAFSGASATLLIVNQFV